MPISSKTPRTSSSKHRLQHLHVNDKPIQIELPASIEMKVIESAEGIKGDTASNVQKPATLETGLVVQVPLFVKEGDVLKISTSEKSYMGRA